MHTNEPREDPLVEMGYEIRDVNYPAFRKALVYFGVFGAACAVVAWFIYVNRLKFFAVSGGAPQTNATRRRLPELPNPELQNNVTTKTDIRLLRQMEDARLNGTGYTDATRTHAYIPIEKAMEMIATNGLKPTGRDLPANNPGNQTGQNAMPTGTTTTPPAAEPNANPGTVPGHETTGGTAPATSNNTQDVPVPGDPHASAAKPKPKAAKP